MENELIEAYWAGRHDYPNEPNPYPDDHVKARMWRLGWQKSRDIAAGTDQK